MSLLLSAVSWPMVIYLQLPHSYNFFVFSNWLHYDETASAHGECAVQAAKHIELNAGEIHYEW